MPIRIRKMKNGAIAANGYGYTLSMLPAEITPVEIDFSDFGTVSSVAQTGGSLTIASLAHASNIATLNITAPTARSYADITATLSTGEKTTQRINAAPRGGQAMTDYDG